MSNELQKKSDEPVVVLVEVFCPKCGHRFTYETKHGGKVLGGVGGAAAGAALGAKIGIVGGPLGAIAGTVPGAILGALFGTSKVGKLDRSKCKKCSTSFEVPGK